MSTGRDLVRPAPDERPKVPTASFEAIPAPAEQLPRARMNMPDGRDPGQEPPSRLDPTSLRRADWRVLLPIPENGFEHLVVLGGPDGLGDALIELGVARRVSREIPDARDADAMAILHDARVRLEDAGDALLAGGTLYWELESSGPLTGWTKKRIGSRLRRAGLSLTGRYWVRPDFENGELFIPVHVETALEWYSGTLADASPRFSSILGSPLGRRAIALALKTRSVRHCSVTAVAGPRSSASPSILSHPAVLRGSASSPLVICPAGTDASRRIVVLPFERGSVKPSTVLKFSRFSERNADIQREQDTAAQIRSHLDDRMRETIPTPLGTSVWSRAIVGAETYAGRSIWNHSPSSKRRRIEDLRLVERWLSEFHRQSGAGREPFSESQVDLWVGQPIAAYRETVGSTPREEMLFEKVRERARSLRGTPFPLVWSHPGFSELNICRSGDDIRVIDWEGAQIGPPLRDWIYFLTLWFHSSGHDRGPQAQARSFRELFFPSVSDPLRELAWTALEEHMRSLALDRRFFPVMLALTWVEHALGRVKRLQSFGEPGSDLRRRNLSVRFVEILAEQRDRLFDSKQT